MKTKVVPKPPPTSPSKPYTDNGTTRVSQWVAAGHSQTENPSLL
jgi:hypothetical protein